MIFILLFRECKATCLHVIRSIEFWQLTPFCQQCIISYILKVGLLLLAGRST